jgi:hypothetical protein
MIEVVPKIERYSQAPVIDFLKSISNQDVYVTTSGFYSYAPFFYFGTKPDGKSERSDKDWLINGNIDKPVYIITKPAYRNLFNKRADCRFLKQEGGYLFYYREPALVK